MSERLYILSILIVLVLSVAWAQSSHAYPVNCYYNSQTSMVECHAGSNGDE